MTDEYRQHHYVPQWYQQRFMLPGQGKYHYLDLKPESIVRDGHRFTRRGLLNWGPVRCFREKDLYSTRWGASYNVDIEKYFFGETDKVGKYAVEQFDAFEHPNWPKDAFNQLLAFMSIQKLRTPKGLGWLSKTAPLADKNLTLMLLQRVQHLHCATWTECVWQLADTDKSDVKFIVSDHPVTVYNRACFPFSDFCRGDNDPDIRLVATHTFFPLSLRRILILTNLSWARNPYQRETNVRPNPDLFRQAMFNFMSIQTHRSLTCEEVMQINYIIKMRAKRFIAAAEPDWLYPERNLKNPNWKKLGGGYLLMPEPRDIHMGGEIFIGYKDGRSEAFNEYGQRPWQQGYKDERRFQQESDALLRFQAEFARLHGPAWRGTSGEFGRSGPNSDSDEYHQYLLAAAAAIDKKKK